MRLECRHIVFNYPQTDEAVFKDLSLDLTEPGLHALFGPSGVGKTSLAHILTGRLQAPVGNIHADQIKTLLYAYNMERLPGWSSVGRHLERITPAHKTTQKEELVKVFGLKPYLHQRFAQLSLGQQNRINLVRYLVQEFQLLIMDESLANVDEKMRADILFAIKEMFPHTFFIYISHNVVEVAKFCRQIWVLRKAHKSPQAVMVPGEDQQRHEPLDHEALQQTMLEMMNAA